MSVDMGFSLLFPEGGVSVLRWAIAAKLIFHRQQFRLLASLSFREYIPYRSAVLVLCNLEYFVYNT